MPVHNPIIPPLHRIPQAVRGKGLANSNWQIFRPSLPPHLGIYLPRPDWRYNLCKYATSCPVATTITVGALSTGPSFDAWLSICVGVSQCVCVCVCRCKHNKKNRMAIIFISSIPLSLQLVVPNALMFHSFDSFGQHTVQSRLFRRVVNYPK